MNPNTVNKDSNSLVTNNAFDEFNKNLTGKPAQPGKKDSQTMGKPATSAGNAFEQFNETIKKKDLPGVSGDGSSPASGSGASASPEVSTSSLNGEGGSGITAAVEGANKAMKNYLPKEQRPNVSGADDIIAQMKKNLEDSQAFLQNDLNGQPELSPYPAVMGKDGKPLPDQYQPSKQAMDPNSGKIPEKVAIMHSPEKMSRYVNSRIASINGQIDALAKEQSQYVTYEQKGSGKSIDQGATPELKEVITNPGEYSRLGRQIMKQQEYVRQLQKSNIEVVSNNLIREHLASPHMLYDVNLGTPHTNVGIPRDLGRKIIRYADKETNDQFEALENKNTPLGGIPNADMERIGLESWKKYILLHDDLPNRESLIKDIEKWEEDFDENNFELTAARVRHKIGADLKEHSGFGSSIYRAEPSIPEIIASAKRAGLTKSEMKIFESYVLPVEQRNWGTDIPMSGFLNKFGEAIQSNAIGLTNIFRGDTERLSEALNQELNTRFDEVGEFSRDKQELKQLKAKEKSKQGITDTEKTRKQQLEKYVDVRQWYDKFWDGAGDITGQVAYQAGLARFFGVVGNLTKTAPLVGGMLSKGTTMVGGKDAINLMMSSFVTSYDNYAKEAVTMMPRADQALERRMYAYTMSAVEGLSEKIFPDTKVLDAFKRSIKPEVAKLTSRLAAKEISEEAAKTRLQQIISNKLTPFAKGFVKAELQESSEESVVDIAKGISDTIFAGKDFDMQATFGNAAETFITTMAYSPFVSGMAATKDVRSAALGKSGLYKMSVDPESYRREVYRQVEEGSLPQAEADKKIQIINTAAEIQKQLPVKKSIDPKKNPELAELNNKWKENITAIGERTDIDETQKEELKKAEDERSSQEIADYMKEAGLNNDKVLDYPDRVNYLVHRLNESILEKQISETKDEIIKADLQRQLDRSKQIREGIFDGTIIVGNNLDLLTADQKKADELGITPLAQADDDTLPINISKPKLQENEKGNASEGQQTREESDGSENIRPEEGAGEQAVRTEQGEQVTAPATEEGKPTLPAGMSQEQFNKLPTKIQEKLMSKNKPAEKQYTEAEKMRMEADTLTTEANLLPPDDPNKQIMWDKAKNLRTEANDREALDEKEKEYNAQSVDDLVKLKKELYPNPDIESAMSPEEKLLDRVIAAKYSEINQAIIAKRKKINRAGELKPLKLDQSEEEYQKQLKEWERDNKKITPVEQDAIDSLLSKDLTGTGLAPYIDDLKKADGNVIAQKQTLRSISDQLTDVNSAERVGSELGAELSDKIYDLGYPEVGNTEFAARAKETTASNEFEEKDGKVVSTKATEALPADVSYQPLDNIATDVERFQPRGTDFSEESVNKIVNDYDENKLDPIVLYKHGKDYVLAGHSRFEAHKRLTEMPDTDPRKIKAIENGFRPGEIKARYFSGSEKKAIEFADRSNDLGTKNKDYESAASLRKMRESGDTKTAIKDRAKTDFGKNWRYLYNLSFLNPNGKIIQTLQQFENNPDKDAQNQIEKAGQWIGAVRERLGDLLSNQHENEMFDYLMDKGRSTKIQRENDFINIIQNVTGSAFYKPNEPLNLNRIKNKSAAEVNYDSEEQEIKESISQRQKELDDLNDRLNNPQNTGYVNPNAPDYKEVLRNAEKKKTGINAELTGLRKDLLEHQQSKGKVISAGLAQPGLFDVNNLNPEETSELNKELEPDGITVQNIQQYEQDISDTEEIPEQNNNQQGQAEILPEAVRQPANDQSPGAQQDQSSAAVQGQQRSGTTVEMPQSFFDLMPDEMAGLVTSTLKKGDIINVGNVDWQVTRDNAKEFIIKNLKTGKSGTILKIGNSYHAWARSRKDNQAGQFFRDIEGDLTRSLLDRNNPLGPTVTESYQRAINEFNRIKSTSNPVAIEPVAISNGKTFVNPDNTIAPEVSKTGTLNEFPKYPYPKDLTGEYPQLAAIEEVKDENEDSPYHQLPTATSNDLWLLSQMSHPNDYGFKIGRSSVLREWEKRGDSTFKELGLPTDMNYPYKNRHTGTIETLSDAMDAKDEMNHWWSVAEHARPVADIAKELTTQKAKLAELKNAGKKLKKEQDKRENKWAQDAVESHIQVLANYKPEKAVSKPAPGASASVTQPITEVDTVEQQKREALQKAKDDFRASLRKSRGNLKASFVPIDAEVIANGVKLMAAYADLGLYKFKQIVQDIAETIGADFLDKDNVNALKGVYSYYRSNTPKEERGQFDTEEDVDEFLENELQAYTSPVDSSPKTEEQAIQEMIDYYDEDPETQDHYRRELEQLKNNPRQYWQDLYDAYSEGDQDERKLEAAENLKKLNDGTGTATNLATDSTRTTADNELGQGELFPVGSRNIKETESGEQEIISTIQPAGSPGLLPFDAVTDGTYSDSQLPIEQQLSGLETSPAGNTDSGGSDTVDETGVSPDGGADESIERIAEQITGQSISEKIAAQKAAENIPVKDQDLDNIRATLPFLMKEQQEDVYKAENRFFGEGNDENKLYGKGILFTNGTGTGKTLTGLGIIKRMIKRGKANGIIVVPSDPKAKDWIAEGKDYMGIPIHQLTGVLDGGKDGANITTYANFRDNANIRNKTWDWVVYDESHKINSNGQGGLTSGESAHKDITTSPRMARVKAKVAINYDQRLAEISKKNSDARERGGEIDYEAGKLLDEELKNQTIKEFKKTKVVFLSATPFSYHPNLTYADGYLYQITEEFDPQYGSNSYNNFYIQNFGYRIRYNKLTKPESGVDVDLLERQFTENLKKNGVVVSRKLNVDKDYSRQFVTLDDQLGEKIDEGISLMSDYENYPYLAMNLHKHLSFLYKNQLMEGIKAKWAVDRIQQHLDLGRKVVVSHTYIDNEPLHPFRFHAGDLVGPDYPDYQRLQGEIESFREEHPEFWNLDISGLKSPIQTLSEAFKGKIVFFNGRETKKDRTENKRKFNDDNSGIDIFVVQMDAGKEGISLHDKTGKHQRALINLGLPYKPTDAIQIEGRIYRTGQKSDAVIEYPILNLSFERLAYANKINERVRTAENFALGEEARNLETAFKEGYLNATDEAASLEQGKGGKQEDARTDTTSEFKKTLTYYYKRGKRTAADKRNVEGDYYATPEPLGYKMAEWMDLVPNEKGLEPSSGHGAIARFFPRTTKNIFIEPNTKLRSETAMNAFGETKAGTFEDLNIINKFDGIAMNPPFGRGGKLAMEHLEKALGHLHDGGRVVALVPTGQMNDRLANWMDSEKSKGFYITAKIKLPQVVFERAGTQVATQIIVIDKVLDEKKVPQLPVQRNIDLSDYSNIKDFFDAIEDLSLSKRIDAGKYAEETLPNEAEKVEPQSMGSSTGEAAPINDMAEVIKNFHQKAQRDNYVVKLKKQLSNDEFKSAAAMAKDLGGYWSSFKGNGAVPGFQFDNEQAANNLISAMTGKDVPESEKMSLADRIRTWKIAQNGRNLYTTIIPGGPQVWNGAVEVVAKLVEGGTALIDALNAGRKFIEDNWKKKWQKAKYNGEMIAELKGRGVLSYTLSPSQVAEADAAIGRISRTGKLIPEINDLREAFDNAKALLTDPADIQDLEDSYTEFERYIFDGLAAQEIDKMENFSLGLEDQTWWQKQKENWQNRFQRLEQIQKEIEASGLTIEEKNDMVNRADRWKSIAAAKIDNVLREVGLSEVDVFVWKTRKKLENSLFDQMAKDGVDYRKFNLFMYAKHAPERNAHNARLRREAFAKKIAMIEADIQKYKDNYAAAPNPTTKGLITRSENELKAYEEYEAEYNNPTGNKNYLKLLEKKIERKYLLMDDGGSGMTNEQAAEIIDEVDKEGNTAKFEEYEKLFQDKIIQQSLELQKEYGLIDDENYEYMKNYYQNYVPLKVDDSYFEKNQTFTDSGIPGAKIYSSKGANYHTFENRVNPLTQSILDLQATIFEGEQNRYKQTVAETIKTAPDKEIWQLKSALYAPIKDKAGKVVGLNEINVPPNGIPYFDNGQKKYLVINDKALHEAMTGKNLKTAIPLLAKINGFFRSIYTVYNPAFTVTNLFRDMETAGIVMSATQKGDVGSNFRGNTRRILSIIRGVYQAQGGADKTYWQQRAKEYKDAGGNMTWFQQDTAADQIEDIEAAYKKYEQGGAFEAGKNLAIKLADFINKANTAVENSTRLAMYDALMKSGVPQYKAVEIARNATINFQKKGNYGGMVDSLYLFYNASVQGTANVLKTLLTTRAGLKMAGGIILAGAMLNVYNNLMSDCGPEADPANCYDNIPDYEKEKNMIIKIPGGRGFLKIPLAWGFNVFFNGGDQISQIMHGKTDWQKASAFLTKSMFNSFNPTGGVDQPVLQHLSPTATDPIVQWYTNKDAFGRPIRSDNKYDRRPDSEKGFVTDSKNAKELAAWLNRQTGGNEKIKGKIDVAPGTLDWTYETFTGGTGQFMSQSIGSLRNAFDPNEDVKVKEIPILNRFYTAPREKSNRQYIFNQLDDSYNTILSPDELQGFNIELDKAMRLGEIKPEKGEKYRRTLIKNQYELTNQDLFSVIDQSKERKLEQYEIDNFVEELNRRADGGEIPKDWIKTYKTEITKNQKPYREE